FQDENDAVSCLLKAGADFTQARLLWLHAAALRRNEWQPGWPPPACLLNFELNQRKDSPVRRGGSAYASSAADLADHGQRGHDARFTWPARTAKAGAVRLLLQTSASAESELGRHQRPDGAALGLLSESDADICGQLLAAAEAAGEGFLKRFVNKKDVEHGAFVNATNTAEQTPLHLAARTGNIRLMELLVQHGAKLDAVDATRQTATSSLRLSLLANLLGAARDGPPVQPRLPGPEGNTPLMLASTEKDDPECAPDCCWPKAPARCALTVRAGPLYNRQVLQALLDHPAVRDARIIDESDAANNSPLHVACRNGHVDIVELLLENGADAEAKNEDEETPMHLAAQAGHLQVVRRLLKINLSLAFDEDEDSNTPMHMAALAGQARICQLLIEEGKADVNAPGTARGWTALDCAASKAFTN
uniref:ANK_REP_REGION domain-containing protein n=1 Tax=Macrostomum lignano TaxID=282301 RepID=A0A1I8FPS8_9PLAT